MSDGAQFTRPCPRCGRVVPRHVRTCRCGEELPEATASPPAALPPPDAPMSGQPAGQPTVMWLGWGMAVVLAGILVWTLFRPGPVQVEVSLEEAPTEAKPVAAAPPKPTDAASPAAAPSQVPGRPPETGVATGSATAPGIEDVLSRAMPAVVSLRTTAGSGSGFFLSPDTIITNEHVVAGHSHVTVRTHDGVERPGRVVSRQASVDLATVKLSQPVPQLALPVGRLSDVRVGQEVLAIGSPLGIENTVTRGIVSGIRRVGTVTLLQTDAAVNPGNSGGPLLNRQGQVVGITTLKLSRAEQMSFAVAIDHALPLLEGRTQPAQPPLRSILPGAAPEPSDTDVMRDRAERTFGTALQRAQVAAANFKADFDRYNSACNPRLRWEHAFNPKDPAAATEMAKETTYRCRAQWTDLTEQADAMKPFFRQIEDRARRDGILPGVMRDLLARYGLDDIAAAATR